LTLGIFGSFSLDEQPWFCTLCNLLRAMFLLLGGFISLRHPDGEQFVSDIGNWIAAGATKVFNVFKVGAANVVSRVLLRFGLSLVSMNTRYLASRISLRTT
jgi:hypothetical protein